MRPLKLLKRKTKKTLKANKAYCTRNWGRPALIGRPFYVSAFPVSVISHTSGGAP